MILITGPTGNVGSQVITALLPAQAGHIRVLTRNPGAVFPDGTQKVVADLGNSDLAPVLDGVRAVFLLTDGLNIAAHDRRVIAAALRAGVERMVKLSVFADQTRRRRPDHHLAPGRGLGDPRQRPPGGAIVRWRRRARFLGHETTRWLANGSAKCKRGHSARPYLDLARAALLGGSQIKASARTPKCTVPVLADSSCLTECPNGVGDSR